MTPHIAACRNVTVVAHLAHGVVLPPVWPLPLDGVLEAVARRDLLGVDYGAGRWISAEQRAWLSTPEAESARHGHHRPAWLAAIDRQTRRPALPLATYGRGRPSLGRQWVWLASCATWPGELADLRYWHRRFGDAAAERVCGDRLPAMVYDTHGRYRSYRVPLVVTLTPHLRWRCCAAPDDLVALCQRVDQLGKKRSQGEGRVIHWEVRDEGPADPAWALWTEDGLVARPIPARAAPHLGLVAPQVVPAAIRAPYWRPPESMAGDAKHRQWRDVLAPTTRRPEAAR